MEEEEGGERGRGLVLLLLLAPVEVDEAERDPSLSRAMVWLLAGMGLSAKDSLPFVI